jgi:hypothetical protein
VTLSVADHGYAKRAGCAAQFAIERGKRQSPALGQFEIGGIMQYQLEMPGELEGGRPGVAVRLRIYRDFKHCQVRKCCIAVGDIDATSAQPHAKAVGNL